MTTAAYAGRSCEDQRPNVQTVVQGLNLAEQTAKALDASGANVVLLARAGQDLSRWNLQYSHAGWAYRDGQGHWRVVHKLNTCGTDSAYLYRQGLAEFFLDDLWRYEAAWIVPQPDVQRKLLAKLPDNAAALLLNERNYNLVSYAWGTKYQQSNQWAFEFLAQSMEPSLVQTRAQAQAWLQLRNYVPQRLQIRALSRLGGRISAANIAFDDHPSSQRFQDQIDTITVDSLFRWMAAVQLAQADVQTVELR
ncbi:DUF2145 domain-containing protein [Lampropedia puyangensis]|uniref:DUF2145 domain-containing protein n=2 Tax=Lampropedia puyangensis TaxID=1330072 RepID=A0A4S8EVZ4_9BURK|nr:DUF2145 domain-containing protein [Lampropedia puyangensis]THT99049.1 DUF2145 domain-containing protein [Lampropedia puyangensis]